MSLFSLVLFGLLCNHTTQIRFILSENTWEYIRFEKNYKTGWFQTSVDHYGFENNDKFSIKYLFSDEFYKPGGPIFFYAGNEGRIEGFAENTGFMWEHAAEFNALIIFVEHRYYGDSIPYINTPQFNKTSLTYLTSEQAMSDYIDLISNLFDPEDKVIAFGGSYGGMLAAWMRMKYPAYITGALASSAPILMFEGYSDCTSPYEIITESFRLAHKNSVENIRTLWKVLQSHENDSQYLQWLWAKLNLCDQPDMKTLIGNIIEIFFDVAMVNYPSASTLLVPLPAYPVFTISNFFGSLDMKENELIRSLALTLNFYFNNTGNTPKCFDFADVSGPVDDFAWGYQSCTEFVLYICSRESAGNMFPPQEYNITTMAEQCRTTYGVTPRPKFIPKQTNIRDLSSYSNIIFSNGDLDPWSAGGYYGNKTNGLSVIKIKGGAHHVDLRGASRNDPQSVVSARKQEVKLIRKWLN